MDILQAMARLPDRHLPSHWMVEAAVIRARLAGLRRGSVRTVAASPGGRPIELVTYGEAEDGPGPANFGSAIGGYRVEAYRDRRIRRRPVILLVGPVHGHEVEGLVGLMNLIEVLETGRDLSGTGRERLLSLAQRCCILIIPLGNPDGHARFTAQALNGMAMDDVRFWGQGTWSDGSFCGYPHCKQRHPMQGPDLGFLGCYFDDLGINPMHDEFTAPMGPEAPAILEVARRSAPDLAISLHSHQNPPEFLRPAYLPADAAASAHALAGRTYALLQRQGLPHSQLYEPAVASTATMTSFNLVSALHHVSGAVPALFECPHGIVDGCQVNFDDILEVQMLLFEAICEHALAMRG